MFSLIIQDSDQTHKNFPLERGSFRTPDNMEKLLGLSRSTVNRSLRDLEERKYVIRDDGYK